MDQLARRTAALRPRRLPERAATLSAQLAALRFRQFVFHCQWNELRQYANERHILLFGDIPIYVHLESADVWAHQSQFNLDEHGHPLTVTGVPPDYFCAEGQLWGIRSTTGR
ncbi:MAG: 4-alpha-glucanotransferase [Halioglobus sp.]